MTHQVLESSTTAFQTLFLIHQLLQQGSPPGLADVFSGRKVLQAMHQAWDWRQLADKTTIGPEAPVTDLLSAHAEYLL